MLLCKVLQYIPSNDLGIGIGLGHMLLCKVLQYIPSNDQQMILNVEVPDSYLDARHSSRPRLVCTGARAHQLYNGVVSRPFLEEDAVSIVHDHVHFSACLRTSCQHVQPVRDDWLSAHWKQRLRDALKLLVSAALLDVLLQPRPEACS